MKIHFILILSLVCLEGFASSSEESGRGSSPSSSSSDDSLAYGRKGRVDFGERPHHHHRKHPMHSHFKKGQHKEMFAQADELMDEEYGEGAVYARESQEAMRDVDRAHRKHQVELSRARLRAQKAAGAYDQAVPPAQRDKGDNYRKFFEDAEGIDMPSDQEYSRAKVKWWNEHGFDFKKKFFESTKSFHQRVYNKMLDDLKNDFPAQVDAEISMKRSEE